LIWLAAALFALGQADALECGRRRDQAELQPCAFVRDEQADILDAAGRPPAEALGPEAIRFSSRPQLGGRAAVAEIVRLPSGAAEVRLSTLSGHWRTGWDMQATQRFALTAVEYRRLAAQVDEALAAYRPPVPNADNGEAIVCTDGPGFLTERVRAGHIVTLTGQCPPTLNERHPNDTIAASIDALLCRKIGRALRTGPFNQRRCRRR